MSKTINLGPVSAYALAKKHGFTGTEAEWLKSLGPHIGSNGNWWVGNEDTGVLADPADLQALTQQAQTAQSAAEDAAGAAAESAEAAQRSASNAGSAASAAADSASAAKTAQEAAAKSTSAATDSAAAAQTSSEEASKSANDAAGSATAAQNAQTAAEAAQTKADADAEATAEARKIVESAAEAETARVEAEQKREKAETARENTVNQLKEDIFNINKKKNVVLYVGSSQLSDEQKLSCDYICDGVDDQIEINQAINSLPDSGGEIHLSRGIFNISNPVTIRKRIKIVGEGKGITLDRNNVNNGGTTLLSELTFGSIILIEKSNTLSDIKGITLSDFQIVGAGINVENNFCNGINITTYTDCVTLERLAICHCFWGLFVDQSATVDDISVTNCDFQRDTTGIYIYGQGWQTRIENNIFWDMSGRGQTSGIVLSAGKNIVNGNYFGVSSLVSQDVGTAWISAKNAVSLLCNGNSFSKCAASPIRFEAGGQFATISGNSFSEIGNAQFYPNERAVLYVDGAGTGGGRISFTDNTVFWADGDDWKTSYLAFLTNQVAQVNISNNTVIDGIGKITEDELVYKSEDSVYAITIGNNVLC